MDIEKAMNFLKNTVTRDNGFSPVFIANMDILIGYAEEQLINRWIPVSERLPEKNKHVLLFLRNSEGKERQVVGYLYTYKFKSSLRFMESSF
jgi:hypothetical protein